MSENVNIKKEGLQMQRDHASTLSVITTSDLQAH